MNDTEKDRIAAAFNQLRPDWPLKSIRTLLDRPGLAARPRRDVVVALGWVACENATATPARVLEAGPWWRAAAIEGQAHVRDVAPVGQRCTVCGRTKDACRRDEHEFTRPHARDVDLTPVVAELKGHIRASAREEGEQDG